MTVLKIRTDYEYRPKCPKEFNDSRVFGFYVVCTAFTFLNDLELSVFFFLSVRLPGSDIRRDFGILGIFVWTSCTSAIWRATRRFRKAVLPLTACSRTPHRSGTTAEVSSVPFPLTLTCILKRPCTYIKGMKRQPMEFHHGRFIRSLFCSSLPVQPR